MTPLEARTNLREILADLYSDEDSASRIAADAGLDTKLIAFSGVIINTWESILRVAENTGKISGLRVAVLREYGANSKLRSAWEVYLHYAEGKPEDPIEKEVVRQPSTPQRPAISTRTEAPMPKTTRRGDSSKETVREPSAKATTLSVKGSEPGTTGVYLIEGEGFKEYKKGDGLVVYDDFGGAEVAIALLKVTKINPNSLSAQATLIHPNRGILSGLRVDDKLNYLSTSELVPAADYAIGYLVSEGLIRLRPDSEVDKSPTLVALEPRIIDGTTVDQIESDILMRVKRVGQQGAVAEVELTKGSWPQIGSLVKQSQKVPDIPPILWWFPIAGVILLFATVGFLMFLFLRGDRVDSSNSPILTLIAAFAGGAFFFLGGWAKVNGIFSLPGFPDNPIHFGIVGGLAGFVIVLLIIRFVFGDSILGPTLQPTNIPVGATAAAVGATPTEQLPALNTPAALTTTMPSLSPPLCIEPDNLTFTVDDRQQETIVTASTTYSQFVTTTTRVAPPLSISLNGVNNSPECASQLSIEWSHFIDGENVPLPDLHNLFVFGHQPSVNKEEMIQVWIKDGLQFKKGVGASFLLKSVKQED